MNSLKNRIFGTMVVIFSLGCFSIVAQTPITKSGPNGIFVYFGKKIPITFQYKLERKEATETSWEEIYRTSQPDLNYQMTVGKLLQAGSKSASFTIPDSLTTSRFLHLLKGKQTTDSVYLFNGLPAYIETMGTGFYDVSAIKGTPYVYRVSEINRQGYVLKATEIKADPFPGKADLNKPEFTGCTTTSKSAVLKFTLNGKNTPSNVRLFKQAILQTPFSECYPFKMFTRGKDGLGTTLIDSLVLPGVSYRYFLLPVDLLGNLGTPSDTVSINFGQGEIAPLVKFEAKTENNFIVLHWRIPEQKNMRSISIFRSDHFNDGYRLLNRVSVSDSIYSDRQITKGISYFYYLVFEGLTATSTPSAKVIGMVEEKEKPVLEPGSVKVQLTPKGNLVRWRRTEAGIKGYYVYRGESYTTADQQISGLVLSDSLNVMFLDSVSHIVPGRTYCYSVSAVNQGNFNGPHSVAVVCEPMKPELPTPLNLQVQAHDDKAMLYWDDIASMSPFITGYRIFRAEENKGKMDTLMLTNSNMYFDSTVIRGKTYTYAVQAVGIQRSESQLSARANFLLPVILPVPPSGVRATKTVDGVIIHWDSPAVEGLTNFKVYREKLGEQKQLVATVGPDVTLYSESLTMQGTYFYTITSVNGKGVESLSSDEVATMVE
jgi:fibronectin type 3 domain-containing protein